MTESFTISTLIPASPLRIYEAWLDAREHGAFTGGKAEIEPGIGGAFTAWDGYIRGRTLDLEEGERILQSWRTSEFPTGSEDSLLELVLEEVPGGTRLTLSHSNIPEGQAGSYEEGWGEHYFDSMKRYFGRSAAKPAAKSKPKAKARAKAKAKPAPKANRPVKKAVRAASKRSRPAKKAARKPARKPRRTTRRR